MSQEDGLYYSSLYWETPRTSTIFENGNTLLLIHAHIHILSCKSTCCMHHNQCGEKIELLFIHVCCDCWYKSVVWKIWILFHHYIVNIYFKLEIMRSFVILFLSDLQFELVVIWIKWADLLHPNKIE